MIVTNTEAEFQQRAWESSAEALADCFECDLVMWRAHGRWYPTHRQGRRPVWTARWKARREDLEHHFCGIDGKVIGFHAISPQNTSRWFGIDIDDHTEDGEKSYANEQAAVAWYDRLRDLGVWPLLTESSPGSFHLRGQLDRDVPSEMAFNCAQWLVRDWREQGLMAPPETFPKRPRLDPPRVTLGNFLRLPGWHPFKDFWSAAWDGTQWLGPDATIREILSVTRASPSLFPEEAVNYRKPKPATLNSPPACSAADWTPDAEQHVVSAMEYLPADVRPHVHAVLRRMAPGRRNAATFELYCRMLGTSLGKRPLADHRPTFEVFTTLAIQWGRQRTRDRWVCWNDYCACAESARFAWGSRSGQLELAIEQAMSMPVACLPELRRAKVPVRRLAAVCLLLAGPGRRQFGLPQEAIGRILGRPQRTVSHWVQALYDHHGFIRHTRHGRRTTQDREGVYALYRLNAEHPAVLAA